MPRRTFDPTKVRAFPLEFPAKPLQSIWDAEAIELFNENPRLTMAQIVSVTIRDGAPSPRPPFIPQVAAQPHGRHTPTPELPLQRIAPLERLGKCGRDSGHATDYVGVSKICHRVDTVPSRALTVEDM